MRKLRNFIALGITATLIVSGTRGSVAMATETEGASEIFSVEVSEKALPEITDDNQEISGGNSEENSDERKDEEVTDTDKEAGEENYSEDYTEETSEAVSDGDAEVSDGNAEDPSEDVFVIMPEEISGDFEGDVWNDGTSVLKIDGDSEHITKDEDGNYTVEDGYDWYICQVNDKANMKGISVFQKDSILPLSAELKENDKKLYILSGLDKGENELTAMQFISEIDKLKVTFKADLQAPSVTDWGFEETPLESKNGYYSESPLTLQIFSEDKKEDEKDALEIASGVNNVRVCLNKDGANISRDITPDNDGIAELKISEPGIYRIAEAYAQDRTGKWSESYKIDKYVYIAGRNEKTTYKMQADNKTFPGEAGWLQEGDGTENQGLWYSINRYGNDKISLKINYYVYGDVKLSGEIVPSKEFGDLKDKDSYITKTTNRANLWTKEGLRRLITEEYLILADERMNGTLTYTYKFFGDEERDIKIPLAIDNTAPTGSFNVSFVQNTQKDIVTRVQIKDTTKGQNSKYEYLIGKAEGNVLTNDTSLCLNLTSNNIKDERSGLDSMTYSYSIDGEEKKNNESISLRGKNTALAGIKIGEGIQESTYVIKSVVVEDIAGNKAEFPVDDLGNKIDDKVDYEIDTMAPVIALEAFSNETYKDPDGTLYYKNAIAQNFTIKDKHLDFGSVHATPLEGSDKPTVSKVKDTDKNGTSKYTIEFKQDGKYKFIINAKDKVSNKANPTAANKVVIDTTAPDPDVKFEAAGASIAADPGSKAYSKSKVTAVFTVKEKNIKDDGISGEITGTDSNGNPVSISVPFTAFTKSGDTYTARQAIDMEGEFTASIVATDKCEHTADKKAGTVIVDTTKPTVHIEFDKNEPINGKYFKAQRVATISVEDFTFDKDQTDLKVQASDTQPSVSGWSGSGNHYEQTVTFSADGKYKLSFKCTDKAGNVSETVESDEFIIDRTEPKITISYDNNAAANNMYYRTSRTATISIDELSFDDSTVVVTPLEGENTDQLPQISSFSGGDKNHTASIQFTQDGRYGFSVSCTDLAGNASENKTSEVFVIDTTLPEVTISGVANQSANNGVVAPVVTYVDKNVDTAKTKVSTVGKNSGDISSIANVTQITDGYRAEIADLPHEKKYDDVYVITANVYDLAGNEAKEEIMFSVNRFGSVYYIDDKTASIIDNYYTNVAPEISITEVNIDDLEWKNVSVGRDGEIRDLASGSDYTVSQTENDKAWKSFTYTVKSKNFNKDGKYSVVIASKDKATNEQDNVVKDKEIEFAVDTTEPGIAVSGFENNGVYEEESHLISFNVTDNMGVTGAAVYDDGELLQEYTEEDLEKDGFTEQVELLAADNSRDIKIVSTDVAGNTGEVTFENIVISLAANEVVAAEEEESKTEVLGEKRDKEGEEEEKDNTIPRNTGIPVLPIAAGATGVVVGGYAFLEYLKKKKIK